MFQKCVIFLKFKMGMGKKENFRFLYLIELTACADK